MIERKQSEDTAPHIIVAWLLMLIWEWNWSALCLCLWKAWGKIGTVWKQTAATDLGDDRKQAV